LRLRAELNRLPLDELNARLLAVDPSGAEKIDRQNKRRLVRALEIFAQTNRPASAQRAQWEQSAVNVHGVFVFRERPELYRRIDRRVEEMFRKGVTDEVARLRAISITAAKTLGLAQIRLLLEGHSSSSDSVAEIQRSTRRYAKRQLTWFRRSPSFEPLNLSLLKDHTVAVDWILQKISLLPPLE
jgi:tRNA dimethylallyltransferase